jgi:hypothetical protein
LTIELLSLFILFGLFEASTNPFALPTAWLRSQIELTCSSLTSWVFSCLVCPLPPPPSPSPPKPAVWIAAKIIANQIRFYFHDATVKQSCPVCRILKKATNENGPVQHKENRPSSFTWFYRLINEKGCEWRMQG